MVARVTNVREVADILRTALRAKRVWAAGDSPPEGVERLVEAVGSSAFEEVVRVARSSIDGSRFAALLVARHPDWPWPSPAMALALAHKLGKDRPEQKTARYSALSLLAAREPSVVETLLRNLVLEVPEAAMEVALVADLCGRQRQCPDVFLDAVKKVASVPGQQLVMSGLIFRGFCDLPPDADREIAAEIKLACERFDDAAWIQGGQESRLIELLGDVLALAGVLLQRDVFAMALENTCRILSQRDWSISVAAGLMSPLVMWKGEVEEIAPWLEDEYGARLSQMGDARWGQEAVDLAARVRAGYYRELKRNLVIEAKQLWRRWARERVRSRR